MDDLKIFTYTILVTSIEDYDVLCCIVIASEISK